MNSRRLYTLFLIVSLCNGGMQAQSDSIVQTIEDEQAEVMRKQNFAYNVKDIQLQRRYRPSENDSLFGRGGLRRLYLGGGVGIMVLSDKKVSLSSMTYNAYVGYRFSPVHALRADFSYADLTKEGTDSKIKSIGVGLTYQTDLTNFLGGFRPSRLYSISTLLSGGIRIQPDLEGSRMRPYLSAGLHLSGNPMENLHLYVEPYVGIMARMSAMHQRLNPSKVSVMYGLTGGLQFSAEKALNRYPDGNPLYRNWFIDIAHGAAFNLSGDGSLLRNFGSAREIHVGRWFNPYIGIRAGVNFMEVSRLFNDNVVVTPPVSFRSTQVMLGGSVEFMMSLLNFSEKHRSDGGRSPWDLNIVGGVRFGWLSRANPMLNPDVLRCFYWAPSVALQPMYRVSTGAYIFVEPRWTRPMYYTPYQNTSHSVNHHQDIMSVAVGARVFRPSKEMREQIAADGSMLFTHHAWAGINIGLQRAFAWKKFAVGNTGSDIQPTVGVSAGYDITPLHSARIDASMQRLKTSLYDYGTLSQLVTYKADLRLLYMLNMSNLWQGTRVDAPFKIYGEVGPVLSIVPSQRNEESRTNFGAAVGLYASLRVAPCLDVTVESLGEIHSRRNFIPAQQNTAYGQIEMAFSVGTRYHFLPDSKVVHLFDDISTKPWNNGWFLEAAYGADIPMGTGERGATMAGMTYNIGAGKWLNEFVAVRAGLSARANSWSGGGVYGPDGAYQHSGRSSAFLSGRGEFVLNFLSLLRSRKDATVAPKFDLNFSLGGELGRRSLIDNDSPYRKTYLAMTTSMQALYRVSRDMQLFAEPRYTTTGGQKTLSATIGMRLTRSNEYLKEGDVGKDLFQPAAFIGISGGWAMPIHHDAKDLRALAPTVGVHGGYRFTPLHAARLSVNYEAAKRIEHTEVVTYPTLSTRLMYQFGLSSLWTRNYNSPWNFSLNAGPAVDICLENTEAAKRATFGLAGSMTLDCRVSSNVHVYAEPYLQYNFSDIYPNEFNSTRRRMKLGAEFGITYHILPGSAMDRLFDDLDVKPWNKGFFFETAYGADIPVGTGESGATMAGMGYSVSAGMWLSELIGGRVGLTAHENSWSGGGVYSSDGVYQHSGRSSAFFAMRAELLVNPLALLRARKDATVAPKFDLNLSLGGEFGRRSLIDNDSPYRKTYLAMTTSMQALYRVSRGMQIYAEPRYTTTGGQRVMAASIGVRMTRAKDYVDKESKSGKAFEPGAFFGLTGGWAMPIHHDAKDLRALAPVVGVHGGYRFTPVHGLRLSANYEATKNIENTEVMTYPSVSARLMYQFGLSSLWTQDYASRWNVYVNAGPAVGVCLKDNAADNSFTMGLAGSVTLDCRVSRSIHLYAEPFMQYNFSDIVPNVYNSTRKHMKLGAEFGISYYM